MGVSALLAVGTAYSVYSGEENRKDASRARDEARANAKIQADKADQAVNAAKNKKPNLGAMLTANQNAAKGGASGTMLTGPTGVDPNSLQLGKNTLLGS
jgi:hypothetical protein